MKKSKTKTWRKCGLDGRAAILVLVLLLHHTCSAAAVFAATAVAPANEESADSSKSDSSGSDESASDMPNSDSPESNMSDADSPASDAPGSDAQDSASTSSNTTVSDSAVSGAEKKPNADEESNADEKADAGTAQSPGDKQYLSDIDTFENKFFCHEFPQDSVSARLDRIERLVYGRVLGGSTSKRVSRLLADIPNLAGRGAAQNKSAPDKLTPDATNANNTENAISQADEEKPIYDKSNALNSPERPRSLMSEVAAMEKEVYGKTYNSDTLIDRVARLEATVFPGKGSQNFTPITDRINILIVALQPKFTAPAANYNLLSQNTQSGYPPLAPSYASPVPSYNQPSYNQDKNSDLYNSDTVNSNYVYGAKNNYNDQKKKTHHSIWHKVGKVLAGVGEVAGMAAGSMAMGSMMGYGYGGYGYGYPGFGFGYPGGYGYPMYGYGRGFMGGFW